MVSQSANAEREDAITEVRRLRAEVEDLKARLADIRAVSDVDHAQKDLQPWLRIAATVGVTFALGKLIQALRLPTATAVAIPMISNEVNRRFSLKTGRIIMSNDIIRADAYARWEAEGRPDGQHDRHWQEASEAVKNLACRRPGRPITEAVSGRPVLYLIGRQIRELSRRT